MKRGNPHPLARGVAAVLAIVGSLMAKGVVSMLVLWLGVLVPLIVLTGISRQHVWFVLTILSPLALALFVVWGWVVGAPPGAALGSNPIEGFRFASVVTLRLALVGGITQLCLFSIRSDRLISTLWHWGLKGNRLIIALGCLAVGPEMKLRAGQVLTARYARGLVSNPTLVTRLLQIPYLLRPLLVWVLRSTMQRSEMWHQRHLLTQVRNVSFPDESSSMAASLFYVTLAVFWLTYSTVIVRFFE